MRVLQSLVWPRQDGPKDGLPDKLTEGKMERYKYLNNLREAKKGTAGSNRKKS